MAQNLNPSDNQPKLSLIYRFFKNIPLPLSQDEFEYKTVPNNAIILYPYFAVSKTHLFYPPIKGVKSIVVATFKSKMSAENLVRIQNDLFLSSIGDTFGQSADFKFILNQLYAKSKAVYSKDVDEDPKLFKDNLDIELKNLLNYYQSLYDPNSAREPIPTPILIFMKKGVRRKFKYLTKGSSRFSGDKKSYMTVADIPPNQDILTPTVQQELTQYTMVDTNIAASLSDNPFMGIRSMLLIHKLIVKQLKHFGYNPKSVKIEKKIALNTIFKEYKKLLKNYPGSPVGKLIKRVINDLEERILNLAQYHSIAIKGTSSYQGPEEITVGSFGTNSSGNRNQQYSPKEELSNILDENRRASARYKVGLPEAMYTFYMVKIKSIKVSGKDEEDKYLLWAFIPILIIYMTFFSIKDDDDPIETENMSKLMGMLAPYYADAISTSGRFKSLDDNENFYRKIERILRNFK